MDLCFLFQVLSQRTIYTIIIAAKSVLMFRSGAIYAQRHNVIFVCNASFV